MTKARRQPNWFQDALTRTRARTFSQGTHPQQRRTAAGRHLGPMRELGDDIIISTNLTLNGLTLIGQGAYIPINKIESLYRRNVIDPLVKYMIDRIRIDVPKDTGDLQDSMIASLGPSFSKKRSFPFQIVLNTKGISYANPVNNMPASWIKHTSGTGKFGASLYDPTAKNNWYQLVRLNGRNRAKKLHLAFIKNDLQPLVRKVATIFGIPAKSIYFFTVNMFNTKYS